VLWNNLSWELDVIDVSGVEECFLLLFSSGFLLSHSYQTSDFVTLVIVGSLGLHLLRVCYLEETMGC
jgi:hypothetical protein